MQNVTIEDYIPCRPGEPITAVELSETLLVFGSISGYLGFKEFGPREPTYLKTFMPEMVRAIEFDSNSNKFNILSGDCEVDKVTIEGGERPFVSMDKHTLEGRAHNITICQYSYGIMRRRTVYVFVCFPTQKRQFVVIDDQKKNLWRYDIDSLRFKEYPYKLPELAVPFDCDEKRLLMLSYRENKQKSLIIWNEPTNSETVVKDFSEADLFISHGKLFRQSFVIYAYNNKRVTAVDILTGKEEHLYSHAHCIVALDLFEGMNTRLNAEEETIYPAVISIDFEATLKIFCGLKNVITIDVRRLAGPPNYRLVKEGSLFDMGYPYYIRRVKNRIAITFDEGILVLRTEQH